GLGGLAANGGSTLTHVPVAGAPVVGTSPSSGACVSGVAVDQRGVSRPQGPVCEAGSVEVRDAVAERVAGVDRYQTAANVAGRFSGFPGELDTVYVASGEVPADAVSAAAAAAGGVVPEGMSAPGGGASPVLLVKKDSIPEATRDVLDAIDPAQVVVVGGGGRISVGVEEGLRGYADSVVRVAGPDRFATSAELAALFPAGTDTVFLAGGREEAAGDALSGGPLAAREGAPVLLTRSNRVDPATREVLGAVDPSRVVVLGGPSPVSERVYDRVGATERVWGSNRYRTSAAIAAMFGGEQDAVYVASGVAYTDALTGSALAGALRQPLVLTRDNAAPSSVLDELERLSPTRVALLGGTGAISSDVAEQLDTAYPTWP
ncbi:MAG: cell wall-binding repeat-containing protein, partial [Ornithinimicrobium sp.]